MGSPAPCDRDRQILALWERGVGLGRWARDEALLAAVGSTPSALGARNATLLGLRGCLFERRWPLRSRCPACSTDCEFEADAVALAEELDALAWSSGSTQVEVSGRSIELRAPTADDLRRIAVLPDTQSAARALLATCVSGEIATDALDEHSTASLESYLEHLDPGAVVSFALHCPDCGHEWSAVVDIGEALWSELQRAAEQSLIEIDALARAYGWTESEVLGLSPLRRAAYLQLVGVS
jgi:hypothetical protein